MVKKRKNKVICFISTIILCFSTVIPTNAATCSHSYRIRTETSTEVKCLGTYINYSVSCGNCGARLGGETDVSSSNKLGHNSGREYWLGCNGAYLLFEKRCSRSFSDGVCNVVLMSYTQKCTGQHSWSIN